MRSARTIPTLPVHLPQRPSRRGLRQPFVAPGIAIRRGTTLPTSGRFAQSCSGIMVLRTCLAGGVRLPGFLHCPLLRLPGLLSASSGFLPRLPGFLPGDCILTGFGMARKACRNRVAEQPGDLRCFQPCHGSGQRIGQVRYAWRVPRSLHGALCLDPLRRLLRTGSRLFSFFRHEQQISWFRTLRLENGVGLIGPPSRRPWRLERNRHQCNPRLSLTPGRMLIIRRHGAARGAPARAAETGAGLHALVVRQPATAMADDGIGDNPGVDRDRRSANSGCGQG